MEAYYEIGDMLHAYKFSALFDTLRGNCILGKISSQWELGIGASLKKDFEISWWA